LAFINSIIEIEATCIVDNNTRTEKCLFSVFSCKDRGS